MRDNRNDSTIPRLTGEQVVTDGDVRDGNGADPQEGGGSDETSLTLLALVRAKDEEAWRKLMTLYEPLVRDWCRRCGFRDEDAADVTQEVFVPVPRKIGSYRHDRPGDTFRGWLRTITKSKAL